MTRIGVVDTMFARVDMGRIVLATLEVRRAEGPDFEAVRRTVPGFKDLAVAAKYLIEQEACAIVVACGMAGAAAIDDVCAHEASSGLMLAQLLTSTPILEVFVHASEAPSDEARLHAIAEARCREHARNAWDMVFAPESLIARAGRGIRQGGPDAGPLVTV